MSFTLLSVVVTLVFVIIACIEVDIGAKRGFHWSMISLGTVIFSIFLSFPVTAFLSAVAADAVSPVLGRVEGYAELAALLPALGSLAELLIAMLIAPALFILVFPVLRFALGRAVRFLHRRLCGGSAHRALRDRADRIRGALCGALSAFVLTAALTAPVMGTLTLADEALTAAEPYGEQIIGVENAETARSYADDLAGNLFYRLGGEAVYRTLTGARVDGKRAYLHTETEAVEALIRDFRQARESFSRPAEATQAHILALRRLGAEAGRLAVTERVAANIVSGYALYWLHGLPFLGLEAPVTTEATAPFFHDLLTVCTNTNPTSLGQNTATFSEVWAILLESGVFLAESPAETVAVLDGHGTAEKLRAVLEANPLMKGVNAMTAVTVPLGKHISSLEKTQALALCARLAEAVNRERGLAETGGEPLPDCLGGVLGESGLSVSAELCASLAAQMREDLPERVLTAEDLLTLFDCYRENTLP